MRHVYKCPFAGVLKQAILAHARDQNVGIAVIVIVAHGDAHPVHFDVETRLPSDVSKSAIAVVAV